MDRPGWTESIENPYLHGIHAPVSEETTASDLLVEGELPADLVGAHLRNGPNSVHAPRNQYHWFDGDGMVHGVYFRNGRASYRSRWVRTAGLADEAARGESIWPGVMGPFDFAAPRYYLKDTANTDLVWHAGQVLALWYLCGEPYRLDPATLETLGVDDFGGRRNATISAHPKRDERTGELVWFSLAEFEPPFMTYGVLDERGDLVHQIPVDLPGPRASHDITLTEHHSILHDFPLFHDVDVLREHGHRVSRFHRELPSRFGVVPRRGTSDEIYWFEFEPGYVLHMVNAWEEGDWIVMDGCFQPDPTIVRNPKEGDLASMLGYLRIRAHLHRWRMNLVTGETREEQLDDLNVEFCLPDTRLYGVKTRYSYHQHLPEDMYTVDFRALVKYDHEDGGCVRYDYEPGWCAGESTFAPRPDGEAEDDGYVINLATHAGTHRSEAWVFDARAIEFGPIARVGLPVRVPSGFHAQWLPGERIWSA
ncbi:MAG: carotenoid oxygenase family protein [Myxococcota bacterium]|nr:carotenoid oxygenase family protein [Myxococcota bacterium]